MFSKVLDDRGIEMKRHEIMPHPDVNETVTFLWGNNSTFDRSGPSYFAAPNTFLRRNNSTFDKWPLLYFFGEILLPSTNPGPP